MPARDTSAALQQHWAPARGALQGLRLPVLNTQSQSFEGMNFRKSAGFPFSCTKTQGFAPSCKLASCACQGLCVVMQKNGSEPACSNAVGKGEQFPQQVLLVAL